MDSVLGAMMNLKKQNRSCKGYYPSAGNFKVFQGHIITTNSRTQSCEYKATDITSCSATDILTKMWR